MATVFLGLGSNLGNRQFHIQRGIQELNKNGIAVEKISSIIETDPIGGPPQDKFLNCAVLAKTADNPFQLLDKLKKIEKRLGRRKTIKDGPRPIDIDILFYDRERIDTPRLKIPHPMIPHRDFVKRPLHEIAPGLLKERIP